MKIFKRLGNWLDKQKEERDLIAIGEKYYYDGRKESEIKKKAPLIYKGYLRALKRELYQKKRTQNLKYSVQQERIRSKRPKRESVDMFSPSNTKVSWKGDDSWMGEMKR